MMITLVNTRIKLISDSTGRGVVMPGLLTESGILEVLVDYFAHKSRSISWMKQRRASVKRFLQYVSVNEYQNRPEMQFMEFARTLQSGSFDVETGLDESQLCWFPLRSGEAQRIINGLTDFFDWMLENQYLTMHPNPPVTGGAYERVLKEKAYQYKRSAAFLGHAWAVNSTSSSQNTPQIRYTTNQNRSGGSSDVPAFPEKEFSNLLFKGFKTNGAYNFRDMLITLLMHGAGFRISEPFHLFVSDVTRNSKDEKSLRVLIHHPEQGGVPVTIEKHHPLKKGNRASYLASEYALLPRNRIITTCHAGWKGGRHSSVEGAKFFPAYWFPTEYGELFKELWNQYMKQIARIERNHPYAFINTQRGDVGGMLTMKTFRQSHSEAVQRIGLMPAKKDGTTPHGHRHAYAQRLVGAEVPELTRQICLHHSSIKSQQVYTSPTSKNIEKELQAAAIRLDGSVEIHFADR